MRSFWLNFTPQAKLSFRYWLWHTVASSLLSYGNKASLKKSSNQPDNSSPTHKTRIKTTILSQKTNGSFLIKSFLILWKIINFWKLSVGNYLLFHRFINFARYWNPFYIVQCLWPVTIRTSIFCWFVSFNLTNTKYIWSSVKADKQKATKINLCLI